MEEAVAELQMVVMDVMEVRVEVVLHAMGMGVQVVRVVQVLQVLQVLQASQAE